MCRFVGLSICRSVWLSVVWSVGLSVCRTVGLSVCRSVGLSVCRSVGRRTRFVSFVGLSVSRFCCFADGSVHFWELRSLSSSFWELWESLGLHFGSSGGRLGTILGSVGSSWGRFWGSGAALGSFFGVLGLLWCLWGSLGATLGRPRCPKPNFPTFFPPILGSFWLQFGPSGGSCSSFFGVHVCFFWLAACLLLVLFFSCVLSSAARLLSYQATRHRSPKR